VSDAIDQKGPNVDAVEIGIQVFEIFLAAVVFPEAIGFVDVFYFVFAKDDMTLSGPERGVFIKCIFSIFFEFSPKELLRKSHNPNVAMKLFHTSQPYHL
jgi:hypothetical protein